MWITCLSQFVIVFLIDRAVSTDPLYKVIGSTGFGRQIFQPPVQYYYLKDHSNLEEPGFFIDSSTRTNSHDELPESGPHGAALELQDHGLAEKNSQDQNTLGNHLFYRFPIQRQQLIYYPVHEPSIHQPQSLVHQSIVYDYPHHQSYNAPKYVLQPNPALHNSILSYVYQSHQQIPHNTANSLTNHGEESAKLAESVVSQSKHNFEAPNSDQAQQSDQVEENKSNFEDKTTPKNEHMPIITRMSVMANKSDENMGNNEKNLETGVSTEGSTAKMM